MNSTIITLIIAGIGVALLAAARQGLKSYRVKGKLDGSVIADALEAGIADSLGRGGKNRRRRFGCRRYSCKQTDL
ncbi:MAG: hypothetical protein EBW58_00500 [Betaproteobacteria bacterium]|nr:hypothetical protein [Betaproteobacteria bacterium]